MARDTDRKVISEALRVTVGCENWNQGWDMPNALKSHVLTLTNYDTTEEMEVTYSLAGRITKLVHWQPVAEGSRYASRQPIERNRRQHVLDVIAGVR